MIVDRKEGSRGITPFMVSVSAAGSCEVVLRSERMEKMEVST